jgi:predicted transcriptional regulator
MFKSLLSIGLGCRAKYAKGFVYADSLNLNDKKTETPLV